MNCAKFRYLADSMLSGDASPGTRSALARHAACCRDCGALWDQTLRLGSVLATDEATVGFVDAAFVQRAREGLRAAFNRAQLPPVRFSSLRTPIGIVFVGASDQGVCDLAFGLRSEDAYRARLARRAPEAWRDSAGLAPVLAEIDAYFAGELRDFSAPLDLRGVTPFTARVLRTTQAIPFGELTSYGEVAARLGSVGASRAVGGALGRNPIPIIIPCHRVVQQSGQIGGYTGGLQTKRALLRVEGHVFASGQKKALISRRGLKETG